MAKVISIFDLDRYGMKAVFGAQAESLMELVAGGAGELRTQTPTGVPCKVYFYPAGHGYQVELEMED